jgi:hypothetical protein
MAAGSSIELQRNLSNFQCRDYILAMGLTPSGVAFGMPPNTKDHARLSNDPIGDL